MWNYVSDVLPKEHAPVWTTTNSGVTQQLVRVGNLWFMPDMSMYVYYQTFKWRYAQ